MTPDSRAYIELRFDTDSCDATIVLFRRHYLLPVTAESWEFTLDSKAGDEVAPEVLKDMLVQLIESL